MGCPGVVLVYHTVGHVYLQSGTAVLSPDLHVHSSLHIFWSGFCRPALKGDVHGVPQFSVHYEHRASAKIDRKQIIDAFVDHVPKQVRHSCYCLLQEKTVAQSHPNLNLN